MLNYEGDLEYNDPDGEKLVFGRLQRTVRHVSLQEDRDGWFFMAATDNDGNEVVLHIMPEFIDEMVDFVNEQRMHDLSLHSSVG